MRTCNCRCAVVFTQEYYYALLNKNMKRVTFYPMLKKGGAE